MNRRRKNIKKKIGWRIGSISRREKRKNTRVRRILIKEKKENE
jgi:hypothetical protein